MDPRLSLMRGARVMVVGDLLLDRYWYGATRRISPEAPVPVVAVDPVVKSWGVFEASPINIAEAGRLQPAAVQLMDRAGYR